MVRNSSSYRILGWALTCLLGALNSQIATGAGERVDVELARTGAGSLTIDAEIAGVPARFVVDTGAGMVTVDRALFKQMRRSGDIQEISRVAARLANNRLQMMTVYQVSHFRVGDSCELGPIEVAVMEGTGRNLMGLSALGRAAPFTIHTSPPSITLSGCGSAPTLAAAH